MIELNKIKYHTSLILVLLVFMLNSCNSSIKNEKPVVQMNKPGVAKLVVSEEMHNFGSLQSGEIVSYTFVFRNEGTKSLLIDKAETDCNCTEVKFSKNKIEPGKEGQIEVIFKTAGEVGKVLKTIVIYSNAEQEKKQLFLKANVNNELIEIFS
jgi:hypothetical protein